MLFMVSIFIPGSSQMPDDQFLNIAGKLLDREHGTDSTENSAENLTKNDKTSIIDGLSKLLEMFKDKDTVALKNVNKARKMEAEKDTKSLEEKDTESSEEEEEAKSKEGTDMDKDTYVDPDNIVKTSSRVFNNDDSELKAFELWKKQKEHRGTGSRSLSKGKKRCPEGYQDVSGDPPGDVPGPGLISLGNGRNIPVGKEKPEEKCAEICNHNSRCKSFLYSKKVGKCKITAELMPKEELEPQFKHWVMCSKSDEDKSCAQGYTLKIGTMGGDPSTLLNHRLDLGLEEMHLTAYECRNKCDTHPECKSFEYSEKKQNCVLRSVNIRDKTKTEEHQFEDYRWCSKNPCKTTGGPVANEDCVFPFVWRQKVYKTCTNVGKSNKGKFWCPTLTGDLNVTQDSKTWGYCSDSCPQHEDHCYAIAGPGIGKDCIFPFTDRGKTYDHCASSHPAGTPLWCKTDKTEALSESSKSYGICHSGCNKVAECEWKKLGGEGKVAKNGGKNIQDYHDLTLDECKDVCTLNSACKSFSFKVKGGTCILKDRILNQNSKTKHVPGTSTYYEPVGCHDDSGDQAHAGRKFKFASRNGVEAYGSSEENVAHENESGFDSREKDEVRSIRDGQIPGSRTGTKGASKAIEDISKEQKKIWDKVLQHQNLLKKLVELRNGNV